jgi:hypothetical protein
VREYHQWRRVVVAATPWVGRPGAR